MSATEAALALQAEVDQRAKLLDVPDIRPTTTAAELLVLLRGAGLRLGAIEIVDRDDFTAAMFHSSGIYAGRGARPDLAILDAWRQVAQAMVIQ